MSVTVSECPADGDNMSPFNEKSSHSPEHKEELLGDQVRRPYLHDKLRHTAKGLEAIGFNENASMYQHGVRYGYRHYSIDSQESEKGEKDESKERSVSRPGSSNKRRVSFMKKLMGKDKEREASREGRGEKI